jgi:hypothetical protein
MEPKNKYHNSKIYKIVDNGYTKMYIGSTCQSLAKRLDDHKRIYKNKGRGTSCNEIFDKFGIENVKIELISSIKCENRDELHKIEGKYIQENDCVNKKVAGRTRLEHYHQNKERIKSDVREYNKKNKERIALNKKKYYEANKEKIKAYKQISYVCECGQSLFKINKIKHEKTKQHQKYVQSLVKSIEI